MKRIMFAAATGLVLTLAVSLPPAFAKKVSNHKAAGLMSMCLLDGGKTSEPNNGLYIRCCTSEGAYCIICKQDGSGQCSKTAYSARGNVSRPAAAEPGGLAPGRSTGASRAPNLKSRLNSAFGGFAGQRTLP
ncbi:hypothetical protein [uncultured Hoeflea sp.]|uniref:hypothetical protein n=1 Tax=uncultured Hoeflea sp. TaxID=538666 RepID=UPI0030D924B8|tara:strand:+ start:698 stop:1093 length:396 start_codon:yes stop_codon:yes gene_type:complete